MDRIYVMALVRAFQIGHLDRREFLKRATAAIGSAAAADAWQQTLAWFSQHLG